MATLLSLFLYFLVLVLASASSSKECISGGAECINGNSLVDASAFQRRVASFDEDESVLSSLRGTADNIISHDEIDSLKELLPISEFVGGAGYADKQAYNAPVAYAGLGLKELSTSQETRYEKLLEIREKVRSATEEALGLHPGTLLIDFTHVTQKSVGGAHRAHADNCVHYFDDKTNRATCDPTREHPYPKRVAASILYLNSGESGNFMEGEFYFANRSNGEVDETVPVRAGRMIYFTSGVENLHGALPVKRRTADSNNSDENDAEEKPPRRLALAMWYVTDPDLKEYVPPFREGSTTDNASNISENNAKSKGLKPRRLHDPNDPTAPKELFSVPIPIGMDSTSLFQSMGAYLASQQQQTSWKVSKYGEDVLHVLFKDNSAMFSLDFGVASLDEDSSTPSLYAESSVVVERHTDGRKPASLQYMLQESVMLHGVLEALSKLIMEKLNEGDEEIEQRQYFDIEIEKARSTLPARRV